MSNVFRQIKSRDVHQRPFKAYKQYIKFSSDPGNSTVTQSGIYFNGRIDQKGAIPYITNNDGTNMHVSWYAVRQKFYDNQIGSIPEHVLNPLNQRSLFVSSSLISLPYKEVGERIKNNTFKVTSSIGGLHINLRDDGNGNLIDPIINTSTFASSSRNFFYLSFNNTYNAYKEYLSQGLGAFSGSLSYTLSGQTRQATYNNIHIAPGVDFTSSIKTATPSGLAVRFTDGESSQIRIPHEDEFNRFNKCDDWTISFWAKNTNASDSQDVILSKHALTKKLTFNTEDNVLEFQDFTLANIDGPAGYQNIQDFNVSESRIRVPFHVTIASRGGAGAMQTLFLEASDGTRNIDCPALPVLNSIFHAKSVAQNSWVHWAIRNSASLLEIYADGVSGGFSGSLPPEPTSNNADLTIGSRTTLSGSRETRNIDLAEFRMYDYALTDDNIASLANNHYLSGSCYQTNVVGNVFHRNGTGVVSSVMPKYHSGSGIFGGDHTWNVAYRGTHTIYENQAFIRIPKDVLNASINPTATFTPPTNGAKLGHCGPKQSSLLPGERRKLMFVSGTAVPYITTIGLYNDENELLALGKLAQPIQKRNDIDMNFVVRWDY